MDITAIDRSAISGTSNLHAASTGSKLVAMALVLSAVMMSSNPLLLASYAAAIVAAAWAARLPMRVLLGLATYPAMFAALFAFASAPSFSAGVTIVLKSVVAAVGVVTLVLTTPYPRIFSAVQPVVPPIVGDALLMTYRSFFLLIDRFTHLLTAVRLRAPGKGRSRITRTVRDVSSALANTLLYAFDLAERDYDILYLRGYSGRLRSSRATASKAAADLLVLVGAAAVAVVAGTWSLGSARLDAYSWVPLAASVGVLLVVAVWRWARGTTD